MDNSNFKIGEFKATKKWYPGSYTGGGWLGRKFYTSKTINRKSFTV